MSSVLLSITLRGLRVYSPFAPARASESFLQPLGPQQ